MALGQPKLRVRKLGNRESSLEGPDYYTLARALRLPWLRLDCGVAAEAFLRLT